MIRTSSEFIFKSVDNMMEHFGELDSQARDVAQRFKDNQFIKERHLTPFDMLRRCNLMSITHTDVGMRSDPAVRDAFMYSPSQCVLAMCC